jgi:hypothetical protein
MGLSFLGMSYLRYYTRSKVDKDQHRRDLAMSRMWLICGIGILILAILSIH